MADASRTHTGGVLDALLLADAGAPTVKVDQETRFGIDSQLADLASSSGGSGGISGGSLVASNEESVTGSGQSQAAPKSTESGEVSALFRPLDFCASRLRRLIDSDATSADTHGHGCDKSCWGARQEAEPPLLGANAVTCSSSTLLDLFHKKRNAALGDRFKLVPSRSHHWNQVGHTLLRLRHCTCVCDLIKWLRSWAFCFPGARYAQRSRSALLLSP